MKTLLLILLASILSLQVSAQISEGKLYRESSKPEVYVIHDGKRIWIPTPDALFGMGYDWGQVKVVLDGSLNNFPRFNIPSASLTPGSLIFPPDIGQFLNLDKSHYPVKLSNSTRVLSHSHVATAGFQEIQLTEIRGWLKDDVNPLQGDGKAHPEKAGYDFSFSLIPDYKWLKDNNIDINKVIRVGNIYMQGDYVSGPPPATKNMVTIPYIHVEVNSWKWNDRIPINLPNPPNDWLKFSSASWPFNPNFKTGQYVSVFGSFVTDDPHCSYWEGACDRWAPRLWYPAQGEDHYARYTEIHPADLIQVIDERPQTETTYGLLMYADVGQSNSMSVDLPPKAPKPPGLWKVAYEEIWGPESFNANPGGNCHNTSISTFADHIQVRAITCGGTPPFGAVGRIRALYRLWWEPIPNEMTISPGVSYLPNHSIRVELSAYNLASTQLAGQVYDNRGNYLGTTNSAIIRNPNCRVTKKTQFTTKTDTDGKVHVVSSRCEDWTYAPGSEEFTVKSVGYQDKKITVKYFQTTCE